MRVKNPSGPTTTKNILGSKKPPQKQNPCTFSARVTDNFLHMALKFESQANRFKVKVKNWPKNGPVGKNTYERLAKDYEARSKMLFEGARLLLEEEVECMRSSSGP